MQKTTARANARRTSLGRALAVSMATLILSGCAMTSVPSASFRDGDAPQLPDRWRSHVSTAAATVEAVTADWWRAFGSAELDALVAQAQAQSLDIAAAVARVQQAGATARIAGAALQPELTLAFDAQREGRLGGQAYVDGSSYAAGLSARYEVDFWGGKRAARDGALAGLQAGVFDRDTVVLTTTAAVASNWLQAVALQTRIDVAGHNLRDASALLRLVEARGRAGAALPLELAQQRGLVASQRRAIAALRQQAADAQSRIAVLLGRTPAQLAQGATLSAPGASDGMPDPNAPHTPHAPNDRRDPLEALHVPAIDAGLPSSLLLRRPDIARAEARLASADANVAVARAAMLPSLSLGLGIGWDSTRLRSVFDNPVYTLAAGLAAPVFDAGRLAAGHALAQAQREELLASYRSAIVAAFADAETALNAVAGTDAQAAAQADELAQAQRARALAETRYRAGADTLLTLLDAQRTLYAAQDLAASLKEARLQARVALYKALGGGWQPTTDARPVAVATKRATP
ncbi:pyoverdine export/recycling transporter outer membrane subunit OmpQ [soil metagenome]